MLFQQSHYYYLNMSTEKFTFREIAVIQTWRDNNKYINRIQCRMSEACPFVHTVQKIEPGLPTPKVSNGVQKVSNGVLVGYNFFSNGVQ